MEKAHRNTAPGQYQLGRHCLSNPFVMPSSLSLSIRPARVLATLGAIIAVLVCLSIFGQYSRFFLGHGQLMGLIDGFDVDAETNVPTFFACVQLLVASSLAGVIAYTVRQTGAAFRRHWTGLALLFAYFALDEFVQLHEQLAELPFLPPKEGVLFYAWVVPGMGLVALFGALYARFFWALPVRSKGLFAAAGVLYVGGAIGVEMMAGWYASQYGELSFTHAMITTIEETMELSGVALFVYALLDYLRTHVGGLRVAFGGRAGKDRAARGERWGTGDIPERVGREPAPWA